MVGPFVGGRVYAVGMEQTGEVTLQYERDHFAERLRVRRGQTVRVTGYDGTPTNYRVTRVGMPDADGNVKVAVTSA